MVAMPVLVEVSQKNEIGTKTRTLVVCRMQGSEKEVMAMVVCQQKESETGVMIVVADTKACIHNSPKTYNNN